MIRIKVRLDRVYDGDKDIVVSEKGTREYGFWGLTVWKKEFESTTKPLKDGKTPKSKSGIGFNK